MARYFWGKNSAYQLNLAHPDIRAVMNDALELGIMDFAVIESFRNKEKQNAYFYAVPKKSKAKWPDGKHNRIPSEAVDAVPVINGKQSWNKLHCCILHGIIMSCAVRRGVKLRWGGNWDMDGEPITDQDFQDLAHHEMVGTI